VFSKQSERVSAFLHFLGLLLSIAALVLLVAFAATHATAAYTVGAAIFGSTLILLYATSTIFHMCPRGIQKKRVLLKIDHVMIYVLIAGTYTPVCITMESKGWGWSIFGVVWGLAAIGVWIKLRGIMLNQWLSTGIYIAMGWLIVIAFGPLTQWLNPASIIWLIIGGSAYTLGCTFYFLDRNDATPFSLRMHDIFHLFVIAGSVSHFWAVLELIGQVPG